MHGEEGRGLWNWRTVRCHSFIRYRAFPGGLALLEQKNTIFGFFYWRQAKRSLLMWPTSVPSLLFFLSVGRRLPPGFPTQV